MPNVTGFFNIVKEIKTSLDNNKERDLIIYAFNATGKTRLSYEFNITSEDEERIENLCYNSIVEDYFIWNKKLSRNLPEFLHFERKQQNLLHCYLYIFPQLLCLNQN